MSKKIEDIELRSGDVQEILTKVPSWMIRWGNSFILSVIILILFCSWFIKYPDIINSSAVITTEIPPEKIYSRISGKIEKILIDDNDMVCAEQPLAIIESTSNYEDVLNLKSMLNSIDLRNKNFDFPLDSLNFMSLGDIEAEFALFENNYFQLVLNRKLQPFSNEFIANRYSILELKNRLNSLRGQRGLNEKEFLIKKTEFERYEALFKKGVISAQEYELKQLELSKVERDYRNFENSLSQLREEISNGNKISRGTEINKEKEEFFLLKNVIQSINQLKAKIKDWEYQYILSSNMSGRISFLKVWNKNQSITQGDLIFSVIPNINSPFVAKLQTPIQNSGKIKIGQIVNIRLNNYSYTEYGTLKGKIKNISLVPNKEGFYFIDVELPKKLVTSYNKTIEFKYDMMGEAEIITEDLRIIERLFYQFKEIFRR